jgi:hypothetical protein
VAGKIQRNYQRNLLPWLAAALFAALIAYAWFDGGREPPREISEPLPLPLPAPELRR